MSFLDLGIVQTIQRHGSFDRLPTPTRGRDVRIKSETLSLSQPKIGFGKELVKLLPPSLSKSLMQVYVLSGGGGGGAGQWLFNHQNFRGKAEARTWMGRARATWIVRFPWPSALWRKYLFCFYPIVFSRQTQKSIVRCEGGAGSFCRSGKCSMFISTKVGRDKKVAKAMSIVW